MKPLPNITDNILAQVTSALGVEVVRVRPAPVAAAAIDPNQEWFSTREAAAYLRMTPTALRKHIARGGIRPDTPAQVKDAHSTAAHRFRRATLDAYLSR